MSNYCNTVLSAEPGKTSEIMIGDTTYIVSSFYKREAKGNVVDKIRRLIERDVEIENTALNNNYSGNPHRLEVK
jgi:hypothetical protein